MTTWVFSKVPADAVRRDPNETELFKTEQSGEGLEVNTPKAIGFDRRIENGIRPVINLALSLTLYP
jgi:hypothetical protein